MGIDTLSGAPWGGGGGGGGGAGEGKYYNYLTSLLKNATLKGIKFAHMEHIVSC